MASKTKGTLLSLPVFYPMMESTPVDTPLRPTSDAELMARVQEGSPSAFRHIVERHQDSVLTYITRLIADRARAEELVQETFLDLYRDRDRYEERGLFRSYLFRLATFRGRAELRRRKRRRLLWNSHQPEEDLRVGSPLTAAELSETQQRLLRAMLRLNVQGRSALWLYAVEGLSYEEIAHTLGCRVGTVRSRINRARRTLRETLQEKPHE